jgi:hypothetical protein
MPIALTSIEAKLLRLVMDGAAAPGEIATGAQKFIESLRKRGVSAEEIETAFTSHGLALPKYTRPDFGLIACPFKKHKGELARDIDPHYLRFMVGWIRSHQDPDIPKKFGQWADDMESFLAQR